MGTALIKIRIMPENPETDLKGIEKEAEEVILKNHGKNPNASREPVAFGLNAIVIGFALDESKSIDEVQTPLQRIKGVSSAEVIDFRRAFG